MERRNNLAFGRVGPEDGASVVKYARALAKESILSIVSEGNDAVGPDFLDVIVKTDQSVHENFGRFATGKEKRGLVALHLFKARVGNIYVGPVNASRTEQLIEFLARVSDERLSFSYLVVAWSFAHDHQLGVSWTRSEHGHGCAYLRP